MGTSTFSYNDAVIRVGQGKHLLPWVNFLGGRSNHPQNQVVLTELDAIISGISEIDSSANCAGKEIETHVDMSLGFRLILNQSNIVRTDRNPNSFPATKAFIASYVEK